MCLIFHKWDKWNTVAEGQLLSASDSLGLALPTSEIPQHIEGHYERQRRECKTCGKSQLREERT